MLTIGITAIGGGAGHNVMAALRDSALHTRIVGFDASPWGAGVWECDVAYRVPMADEPDYIPVLLERCRQEDVRLLIPGSDPELLPLALATGEFEAQSCQVLVSSPECVRVCRDKLATYRTLSPLGVPFVTTWSYEEAQACADALPYPLIAKPKGGSASRGLVLLIGPEDWERVPTSEPMVIQPYLFPATWESDPVQLRATMEYLEQTRQPLQREIHALQVILDAQGGILGLYDGLTNMRSGIPVESRPVEVAHVRAACESLISALVPLGLRVTCNAQGYDTREGFQFFEVNPRFAGSTHLRALVGHNEAEAAVRYYGMGEARASVQRRLHARTDWVALRQTHAHEVAVPLDQVQRFSRGNRVVNDPLAITDISSISE